MSVKSFPVVLVANYMNANTAAKTFVAIVLIRQMVVGAIATFVAAVQDLESASPAMTNFALGVQKILSNVRLVQAYFATRQSVVSVFPIVPLAMQRFVEIVR